MGVDLGLQLTDFGDDFAAIEIFDRLVVEIRFFQQSSDLEKCPGTLRVG